MHRREFKYQGLIPSSKSMLNRCLIVASYSPRLEIIGDSRCEDVHKMRRAIMSLGAGTVIDCGSAGTVFRFMSLRASRAPGRHVLSGTQRLFSRPHSEVMQILSKLGVRGEFVNGQFVIESDGWKMPNGPLVIDRSKSSQFATAVLLNAWGLEFPLMLKWSGGRNAIVSEGYWRMTVEMVRGLGMDPREEEDGIVVPAGQSVRASRYQAEIDLSSAFAIAAMASVAGEAVFESFPRRSLQPDRVFVEILEKMGADVRQSGDSLVIRKAPSGLKPIEFELKNSPDLFPVLAALCALAPGVSRLFGAPHLVYKESNRIGKTAELLQAFGRKCELLSEGMVIHGRSPGSPEERANFERSPLNFNPDQDHRLAFAAAVVRAAGYPIRVLHPEVVDKSFPEFWHIVGGR